MLLPFKFQVMFKPCYFSRMKLKYVMILLVILLLTISFFNSSNTDFHKLISTEPVNHHTYKYLHLPEPCKFSDNIHSSIPIITFVKSFAGSVNMRKAIRKVWAHNHNILNVRVVFLLGDSKTHEKAISDEAQEFRDIIQQDFTDAYRNNTLKTVMGFNWAVEYCEDAEYLFHLDDDFYVSFGNAIDYIRTNIAVKHGKYAFVGSHMPILTRPIRDANSRWFVSIEDYPHKEFPPYIGGGAYVMSMHCVRLFQIHFPYIKYISVDDVYLGMVAYVTGIEPKMEILFCPKNSGSLVKECTHDWKKYLKHECDLNPASSLFCLVRNISIL